MESKEGISWPLPEKGRRLPEKGRVTIPKGTGLRYPEPDADEYPRMDSTAFVLLYAMHLCTVEFEDGKSETIAGALKAACWAWETATEGCAPSVIRAEVLAIVREAWEQECRAWWADVGPDMTLDEFDEAADTERPLVLRVAFNRHTGIHETFRNA